MAQIDVVESQEGRIDAADLLVEITKKDILVPQVKKYANICVLAKKKNSGKDLNGKLITAASEVTNDIEESSELNFKGSLCIWNGTLSKQVIQDMQAYGDTLVILGSRTATKDMQSHDFGNMIVWMTQNEKSTSLDSYVFLPNRGVMIDIKKEGKLLYALSHLLHDPNNLSFTTGISHQSFEGINNPVLARSLDQAGYSYWFRAKDKIWVRGFWIGKQQARSVYADRSVMYDIKQVVAAVVNQGLDYDDQGLALLEVKIISALRSNPFVMRIIKVHVPREQKMSSKMEGIVFDVTVAYETAQEVRTVIIRLAGDA